MDRDWINLPRISIEYENGVEEFIKFAQRYEGRSDDEVKFRFIDHVTEVDREMIWQDLLVTNINVIKVIL